MFKVPKRFRLNLYENDGFITIQRRVCFMWITLVDDDRDVLKFKNVLEAETWLNKEKKFGEIFTINYRKVSY